MAYHWDRIDQESAALSTRAPRTADRPARAPVRTAAARPAPARSASATRVREVAAESAAMPVALRPFRALLRTAPLTDRVEIERHGVPWQVVQDLIDQIGVSSTDFQRYVRIPKATFTKKMKDKALFAGTPGQSVVGLMELINRVEDMLAAEPDNAEAQGFDVEAWVGRWIRRPQPALGGLAPAELLDTPSGRESVMRVLGAIQSGAYQ